MMMLEVDGLSVRYGRLTALRGISLRVDEGQIVCIIGPNGAGKSTTLAAIAGGVGIQSGTVRCRHAHDGEALRAPFVLLCRRHDPRAFPDARNWLQHGHHTDQRQEMGRAAQPGTAADSERPKETMTRKSAWEAYVAALTAELLEFAELAPPEPPKTPRARPTPPAAPETPRKRRGRPNVLSNNRLGPYLKAAAEIHSKNKTLRCQQSIARALKKRPEYAALSERTLRRRVKCVLNWEIGLLKTTPTDSWKELLGISPPQGVTTEKALRDKAFELIRHQLRQHQLLAKKQ
jgi:energy-coupling factor transporter ATP-binding protein EcfA2